MILSDRYSEFHACVRIDRQRRQWRRAMQVFSTALPTYAEFNGLAERIRTAATGGRCPSEFQPNSAPLLRMHTKIPRP